jgi:hypothetical protein
VTLGLGAAPGRRWQDLLSGEVFAVGEEGLTVTLWPSWVRVLREINNPGAEH